MKNTFFLFMSLLFAGNSLAQQSSSRMLIPYRVKNLWGFADTSGNLKVNPVYKMVIPNYYYNGEAQKAYARYIVRKTTAWYVLDENMLAKVPETYAYDSIAASPLYAHMNRFEVFKAGKAGLFVDGKQLISCQYDRIESAENNSYIVEKDGLKGLVNSAGKLIIPVKYQSIRTDDDEDDASVEITWIARGMIASERFTDKRLTTATDNWMDGPMVVEAVTEAPSAVRAEPYAAQRSELRKQYDRVTSLSWRDKYVYVEKNGKTGLYNLEQKQLLIEPLYDDMYECSPRYASEPEYFRFLQNRLYGIMDIKGQVLLPAEYHSIQQSNFGYNLEKDGKKGIYVFDRKLLIPAEYESLEGSQYIYFSGSDDYYTLFRVKTATGYGYVGENGVRFFKE